MNLPAPGIYYFYNRGNNQQTIFFSGENYYYFLRKCRNFLKPYGEILAWCLLPNQFHFLIEVTAKGLEPVIVGGNTMPAIINGLRLLQSSYAKAINKQMGRTGSLFQQKARVKPVENVSEIFHYIHQLPVSAGLVVKSSDWPFSSFPDHAKLRAGTLCNSKRAMEWLQPTGGED